MCWTSITRLCICLTTNPIIWIGKESKWGDISPLEEASFSWWKTLSKPHCHHGFIHPCLLLHGVQTNFWKCWWLFFDFCHFWCLWKWGVEAIAHGSLWQWLWELLLYAIHWCMDIDCAWPFLWPCVVGMTCERNGSLVRVQDMVWMQMSYILPREFHDSWEATFDSAVFFALHEWKPDGINQLDGESAQKSNYWHRCFFPEVQAICFLQISWPSLWSTEFLVHSVHK